MIRTEEQFRRPRKQNLFSLERLEHRTPLAADWGMFEVSFEALTDGVEPWHEIASTYDRWQSYEASHSESLPYFHAELALTDQVFNDQVFNDQVFNDQVFTDQVFTDQVFADQVFADQSFGLVELGPSSVDAFFAGEQAFVEEPFFFNEPVFSAEESDWYLDPWALQTTDAYQDDAYHSQAVWQAGFAEATIESLPFDQESKETAFQEIIFDVGAEPIFMTSESDFGSDPHESLDPPETLVVFPEFSGEGEPFQLVAETPIDPAFGSTGTVTPTTNFVEPALRTPRVSNQVSIAPLDEPMEFIEIEALGRTQGAPESPTLDVVGLPAQQVLPANNLSSWDEVALGSVVPPNGVASKSTVATPRRAFDSLLVRDPELGRDQVAAHGQADAPVRDVTTSTGIRGLGLTVLKDHLQQTQSALPDRPSMERRAHHPIELEHDLSANAVDRSLQLHVGAPIEPLNGFKAFNIFHEITAEVAASTDEAWREPIHFASASAGVFSQSPLLFGCAAASAFAYAVLKQREDGENNVSSWVISGHQTISDEMDPFNETRPVVFRLGESA